MTVYEKLKKKEEILSEASWRAESEGKRDAKKDKRNDN